MFLDTQPGCKLECGYDTELIDGRNYFDKDLSFAKEDSRFDDL